MQGSSDLSNVGPSNTEKKSNLEDLMVEFIKESRGRTTALESTVQSHGKAIQNIEVQISQIATSLQTMQKGKFPSCPEINPKEECKAMTLRSGKKLSTPLIIDEDEEQEVDDTIQEQILEDEPKILEKEI